MKKTLWLAPFLLLSIFAYSACTSIDGAGIGNTIKVVAAENFYGDMFKQLGGSRVTVTSLLSDPNADPHQFESSVQDAIAISSAQIVIENGAGYDTWMDKLLSASPNSNRIVLVASSIAPHPLPDNPHVWYGLDNMQAIAQAVTVALQRVDKADAATFAGNLQAFKHSLVPIQQKMNEIKSTFAGTPVGLTETIYLYQSEAMGLHVLTPFAFEKAIAEGNDPPADTVVTANTQINQRQIKTLIYNAQTVTPITTNLLAAAKQHNIPVVSVTETEPAGKTYQQWMLTQLNALEQALESARSLLQPVNFQQ